MITAMQIENFKGIGDPVRIELRPITLLFGPNSAGKSTILQALHYAREVFERRNLDTDQTIAGGKFVDLGGFRNFVHNRTIGNVIRLRFEMAMTEGELPCSWDPELDVGFNDPEFVHLSQRVKSAEVGVAIKWSELGGHPFVAEYSVGINGRPFARLLCDAPRKGARVVDIDVEHPVFFVWPHAKTDPNAAEITPSPPFQMPSETLDALAALAPAGQTEDMFPRERPDYFRTLIEETRKWLVPVGEAGAVGVMDFTDALPDHVWTYQFVALRLAAQAAEGEKDWGEDELTFYQMRPQLANLSRILANLLVGPGQMLRDLLQSFRYLGPIRETPPRGYAPPKSPDPARWSSGIAAWDHLTTAPDTVVQKVSDWLSQPDRLNTHYRVERRQYKRLDLADPLVLALLSGRAFDEVEKAQINLHNLPTEVQIVLVSEDNKLDLLPPDVGIGISQILPVVVAAVEDHERLVIIEQPELHVHPKIQAEVGDLFIETAVGGQHTYLLENHSEHLILRILRRIRETGEGNPHNGVAVTGDDVAVYYVNVEENRTHVRKIDIDKKGEFVQPWPDDFFEIDFYERFA